MKRIAVICCVLIFVVTEPARSQFNQYTEPGSGSEIPEDPAEGAKQAAENARWRFGRLRLHPHLTLTNVGYVQNLFSAPEGTTQVDDAHATLGAGLAGYVRLGSKSLLTAYAAPEYFWWQDSSELREFTLNSGFGWFGDFNRLQLSAILRNSDQQRKLSFEVAAPVTVSEETLGFEAALEITRRFVLFATARDQRIRHARNVEQFVTGLSLQSLDRNGKRQVAGIEVRGNDLELGIGFEKSEADLLTSNGRDNTGDGPLLRVRYQRNKWNVRAGYSNLEFDFEDPDLADRTQVIGSASVAFELRPQTTAIAYAADHLAFTTLSTDGIIESESRGLAIRQSFGERLEIGIFGETGNHVFIDRQNPGREDDLEAYGLSLRFELSEKLILSATVRDNQWNSTLEGFDRSYSSVGLGLGFEGDLLPW